jgi:predicted pyridoxine 5'-phosphate oxidase superfamily flavin-nucleotide-binding protein
MSDPAGDYVAAPGLLSEISFHSAHEAAAVAVARATRPVMRYTWVMSVLTADMQRVVLEQRLGFAATVCPDGTPNLSPKGTTTVWDPDHLVFADIASPGTVRNLRQNPAIELNVVNPFTRTGYRFRGKAELHSDGRIYEEGLALMAERDFGVKPERINTIVLITVERAEPLISPVYEPGVTEEEVLARWREYHLSILNR